MKLVALVAAGLLVPATAFALSTSPAQRDHHLTVWSQRCPITRVTRRPVR